jgi:hypothetical protein
MNYLELLVDLFDDERATDTDADFLESFLTFASAALFLETSILCVPLRATLEGGSYSCAKFYLKKINQYHLKI